VKVLFFFFILFLAFYAERDAFAKKIYIEWKTKPSAITYDLRVMSNGKIVFKKNLDDNQWSGELEPGVYSYQLRSIDKLKRAGEWSGEKSLVVLPKPPEAILPGKSGTVSLFDANAKTALNWKPALGVERYKIQLKRGGQIVYESEVQGTQVFVPALGAGLYSMRVLGVIEAKGRVPASIARKKWESKPSDSVEFNVQRKELAVPLAVYPIGKIAPPADRDIEFKWKAVDGAEAYELTLILEASLRAPAGKPETPLVSTTRETSKVVRISRDGKFQWKVRALANYSGEATPHGTWEAVGPQSATDAELNRNASYFDGAGYLAISTMIAPYNYKFQNQYNGALSNGTIGSAQTTLRFSGEYYFRPEWGVSTAYENTQFTANNAGFGRGQIDAQAKYRWKLSAGRYAWFILPKLGVQSRDYVNLSQDSSGFPVANSFSAFGPSMGFDVRKQFTDRFSLGLKVDYFLPLALSGNVQAQRISGEASYRNFSVGLQGLYWMSNHWGVGAGTYLDDRSISYTPTNPSPSIAPANDSVVADSINFFASLLYSFGR